MKIFLDSASMKEIKHAASLGVIDGVTTNPSLVSGEGAQKSFPDLVRQICRTVKGPVSAEVISTDYKAMVAEARSLAKIDEFVVVKMPLTENGIKATKTVSDEGINVNVTLIFSASQALLAAKAGAAYVSPFIGRLDDVSMRGMDLIEDISQIFANYDFSTEVLVASVRHPVHVVESALAAADVVTLPYKVLMQMFKHPLSDLGLERFLSDWKKKK
ncbi:MAG: fructose-6-phosphate aldolase [Candidatus Mycalebacterium zealandia]|nr:MAG: fructose-6-phosphate aldolase [Candidatus Mycalebacterium zealandia]